jgi:hypothetical protein
MGFHIKNLWILLLANILKITVEPTRYVTKHSLDYIEI